MPTEAMDFLWKVVTALGGLTVILLALVAGTYWLFQTFSDKWLQSKFDSRLEALRHAQNQEMEHLRFAINTMMDRTTKLHEREYQSLPDLWEKLAEAWAAVAAYTSPIQSIPNVSRMNSDELEEHLDRSPLFESQKEAVRNSGDRTRAYSDEVYWHRKVEVEGTARTYSRSLRFNGIFVPPPIKERMSKLNSILWDALLEHQMNQEDKILPRERSAQKRLNGEGNELMNEIEALVQERLWSVRKLSEADTKAGM
jgi:hypothetical protein